MGPDGCADAAALVGHQAVDETPAPKGADAGRGIARIDASDSVIQLQFMPNPPIEPMKIITLIQTRKNYKLAGQDRLRIEVKTPDLKARTIEIRRVFAELS